MNASTKAAYQALLDEIAQAKEGKGDDYLNIQQWANRLGVSHQRATSVIARLMASGDAKKAIRKSYAVYKLPKEFYEIGA